MACVALVVILPQSISLQSSDNTAQPVMQSPGSIPIIIFYYHFPRRDAP